MTDLFGNPPPERAYARRDDPSTSHQAARRMGYVVTKREAEVLQVLREHGTWMSTLDLEAALVERGVDKWTISPRMAPLQRKGLIERQKMKGRNSTGNLVDLIHARITSDEQTRIPGRTDNPSGPGHSAAGNTDAVAGDSDAGGRVHQGSA